MANGRNLVRRSSVTRSRASTYPIDVFADVSGAVQGLAALEDAIKTKVLRSMAFAGSNVFYLEMRMQVPVREGTLYGSIYQWHDDKSSPARQRYFIGPNKREAPHWHFIEFGHWLYNIQIDGKWQRSKSSRSARGPSAHDLPGARQPPVWVPPKPFVRPTWEAKKQAAVTAMKLRGAERLREVMAGMS